MPAVAENTVDVAAAAEYPACVFGADFVAVARKRCLRKLALTVTLSTNTLYWRGSLTWKREWYLRCHLLLPAVETDAESFVDQ